MFAACPKLTSLSLCADIPLFSRLLLIRCTSINTQNRDRQSVRLRMLTHIVLHLAATQNDKHNRSDSALAETNDWPGRKLQQILGVAEFFY